MCGMKTRSCFRSISKSSFEFLLASCFGHFSMLCQKLIDFAPFGLVFSRLHLFEHHFLWISEGRDEFKDKSRISSSCSLRRRHFFVYVFLCFFVCLCVLF